MQPLMLPYQGPSHITSLELITPFLTLGAPKEEGGHFPPVLLGPSVPSLLTHLTNWGFTSGAHPSLCQLFLT